MSIETVNGIEMYYEIHGKGQPFLLIHGLGSSGRDWEYQVDTFSKLYQVITVDVRGHGRTTKASGDYSIELFSDDIAKLMVKLDIRDAHVMGLSMGGMIAFQLAISHPKLVKTMLIVNSGPGFMITNPKAQLKLWLRFIMFKLLSMEKVAGKIATGLFPNKDQQQLRELFVERFIANDKKSYIKSMKMLVKWDINHRLEEITCPSLILAADKDYTSVKSKQNYTNHIANAQLQIIENSHHALPVEKPMEFNQAVLAFLEPL